MAASPALSLPSDVVAGAVLDLMCAQESPSVVNVVHPRPVPWSRIFNAISDTLGSRLPLVPFNQWLAKLERVARDPSPAQLEKIVCTLVSTTKLELADAL